MIGGASFVGPIFPISKVITPAQQSLPFNFEFLNASGSKNMNVDGSNTERKFKFKPAYNESIILTGLSLSIKDEGTNDPDDFGALPTLANGLLLRFKIGFVTYNTINLKTNEDIAHIFGKDHIKGASSQFISDPNFFKGSFEFNDFGVTLNGNSYDEVSFVVRDDLSTLRSLHAHGTYQKVI